MASKLIPLGRPAGAFLLATDIFEFDEYRLYPRERLLLRSGEHIRIGGRVLDLLVALASHYGDVLSRDELLGAVWHDTHVSDCCLRVGVAALRKALGDDGAGRRYIVTVVGRGYSFVGPLKKTSALHPGIAARPGLDSDFE
jgi:DNA-binding winged helix-turn-helix (wHTH) protein